MSKEGKAARLEAHGKYEQRQAAKKAKRGLDPFKLSHDEVRAAVNFALAADPEKMSQASGLKPGILFKIASGQFKTEGDQREAVVLAAVALNWKPE